MSGNVSTESETCKIAQLNMINKTLECDELYDHATKSSISILTVHELYSRDGKIPGFGTTARIIGSDSIYSRIMTGSVILERNTECLNLAHLNTTHYAMCQITNKVGQFYVINMYDANVRFPTSDKDVTVRS